LLQTPADVHEQRRSFHEDDDVDPVAWARS
jgi:hypothetical protein